MDELAALDAAAGELQVRLAAVGPEHLDRASACPGWSVFDLVNHVNGGGHRYLLLLRGAPADALTATRTQDHVRPDALAAHLSRQIPLAAAFAEPGALCRVVHHPVGDRSGRDLLRMRTLDLALHAWDLARSLELDDSLDPRLCDHLLTHGAALVGELRGRGLYAEPGIDDDGGAAQLRLLRLTGRA